MNLPLIAINNAYVVTVFSDAAEHDSTFVFFVQSIVWFAFQNQLFIVITFCTFIADLHERLVSVAAFLQLFQDDDDLIYFETFFFFLQRK